MARFLLALVLAVASPALAATPAELVATADKLAATDDDAASLERAIALYSEAAAQSPRDAQVQVKLASAYLELGTLRNDLGTFTRGEQAATRAIEIDPGIAHAYFLRAANRGRAADIKRKGSVMDKVSLVTLVGTLEKDLRKALELDPRHARAHHMLGVLLYKGSLRPPHDEIERHLKAAIDADPTFASARLDLGEYYLARRRFDEARAQANAVLAMDQGSRSKQWHTHYKPAAEKLLQDIASRRRG